MEDEAKKKILPQFPPFVLIIIMCNLSPLEEAKEKKSREALASSPLG